MKVIKFAGWALLISMLVLRCAIDYDFYGYRREPTLEIKFSNTLKPDEKCATPFPGTVKICFVYSLDYYINTEPYICINVLEKNFETSVNSKEASIFAIVDATNTVPPRYLRVRSTVIHVGCSDQSQFEGLHTLVENFMFPQNDFLRQNVEYVKLLALLVFFLVDYKQILQLFQSVTGSGKNEKVTQQEKSAPLLNSHRICKAIAVHLMVVEHAAKVFNLCNVYVHTLTQCFSPGIFFFFFENVVLPK